MRITLCGSARFEIWFKRWNQILSLSGHVVYGLTAYPSDMGGKKDWYTEEDKKILDRVHKDKIYNSDAILVLNAFAYIGESTLSEIRYAEGEGRRVYALESWAKGKGVVNYSSEPWQPDTYSSGYMEKKLALGIARDYVSPIDTQYYPGPWGMELLGMGGERRSRLVELVKDLP